MVNKIDIFLLTILLFCAHSYAQHEHTDPKKEKPKETMQHEHMQMTEMEHEGNPTSEFLMNEGAGTGINPASSPMHMSMLKRGNWNLMSHGYALLNAIQQTGPRGGDKVFSTNHLMFIGQREFGGKSTFLFRSMFSLEPATVTDRRYPLLFQTGEAAFGRPIVDGQHPHDLFMEISAQYARVLNPDTIVHFYFGLIGDPALGPVAYPHRVSAQELPQATLSHHLQDSTHIVSDVLTAGLKYKWARVELCGFHGAEPDEERWDIDQGAIDSWSTRFTFTPIPNLAAQVSTGHLKKPEELEPGDIQRTTASITYNYPMPDGFWASSIIFGRNHKEAEDLNVNSFLFETLWQFQKMNNVTGRFEVVDKEELFANDPALQEELEETVGRVFQIKAFTFGYARDFDLIPGVQAGLGGNVTLYSFPSALKAFYGDNPKSFLIFFRIRSGHASSHQDHKM